MKTKKIINALAVSYLIFASISNAFACTALVVTDKSGKAYYGRTMEMPYTMPVPSLLTYIPASTAVESNTPNGGKGMSFGTKYAILGMTVAVLPNAKLPLLVEGINDQGLSFSANAMMPSSAAPVGSDPSKILSANEFGMWVLGTHNSLASLKADLLSQNVQVWLPKIAFLGNVEAPLHYAIFDKVGNGLVIEFTQNKMNVYDNPVGVMTNAPEFPWHLTNLNNYTQDNVNKNSGQLGKLKLETVDAGIALSALPSSQTGTGRFVKAAFYANYVQKGKTPDEAVNLLAHIMNNFDRPNDLTIDAPGSSGDGGKSKTASSEVTQWTVMGDLTRNQFYVKSINAMNWSMIDMNKLKGVNKIKSISTYDVDKAGANSFNLFMQ